MATYRVIKNNLNAYVDMTVTGYANQKSVKAVGKYGEQWATQIDWTTDRPEDLEKLLKDNEAIISFERID